MQTSGTVSYAPPKIICLLEIKIACYPNSPVCPLTPRAAPVAVNKTIASRRSWILVCKVDFSSGDNLGLDGSRDNLGDIWIS